MRIAICKSRNKESKKGMMGMRVIGVRVRGIGVEMRGMQGIKGEMEIIKVEIREMREWRELGVGIKEMQGIRVVMIRAFLWEWGWECEESGSE